AAGACGAGRGGPCRGGAGPLGARRAGAGPGAPGGGRARAGGLSTMLPAGGSGVLTATPLPPIRVQACDSLPPPQPAWSTPRVLRIWPVSSKECTTPSTVNSRCGTSPVGLQVMNGASEVSNEPLVGQPALAPEIV